MPWSNRTSFQESLTKINWFVNTFLHLFLSAVCFKIFDADHDGFLSPKELKAMVSAMMAVRSETKSVEEMVRVPYTSYLLPQTSFRVLKILNSKWL